ncbi:MAG: DUF111 family protein [Deltaproteobacteria bacterium]|nr:DUF111 family protein [Deltaproteobacteria bacterium]
MLKKSAAAWVLEANLDDMNPQWFDYCMERLFTAGALDVWLENIQMKKNRPGVLLKALCPAQIKEKAIQIILQETTTLGVRYYRVERRVLERKTKTVATRFGPIPVKIAWDHQLKIRKQIPEYEACRKIAKVKKIPLREVVEEVNKRLALP